jgi:hypothetical protein
MTPSEQTLEHSAHAPKATSVLYCPRHKRSARRFLATAAHEWAGSRLRILSGARTYAEQNALFSHGRNGNSGGIVNNARRTYEPHELQVGNIVLRAYN